MYYYKYQIINRILAEYLWYFENICYQWVNLSFETDLLLKILHIATKMMMVAIKAKIKI